MYWILIYSKYFYRFNTNQLTCYNYKGRNSPWKSAIYALSSVLQHYLYTIKLQVKLNFSSSLFTLGLSSLRAPGVPKVGSLSVRYATYQLAAISIFNTIFFFCSQIAEVIRTRLREEGSRYRSFFQTLLTVPREEGYRALYRGLTTHLVRQIPNTAIMMCTYEVVVYLLGR